MRHSISTPILGRLAAILLAASTVLVAPGTRADDAAAGKKLFVRCGACHQVGENARNGIGPKLNGIVGSHGASVPDYRYSEALKGANLVWDDANLHSFLQKPAARVPGTKMVYPGLSDDKDIADIIAFLARFGPDGKPTP